MNRLAAHEINIVSAAAAPKLNSVLYSNHSIITSPQLITSGCINNNSNHRSNCNPLVTCRVASLLLLPPFQLVHGTHLTRKSRRGLTMATATAQRDKIDLEAFGKAASGSGSPSKERGDCPFSQRVYMELEEKGLQYTATYIEEGPNKPDWFMAKNPQGLMPVLRDGEQWIQDSDKIAQHLEQKYPEHPLKTPPQFKQVGVEIFPAFTNWLKSKNVNDSTKDEYVKELKALNEHLTSHGPFIAGKEPTDSDFALAPKLRHARVALEHYMGFTIPQEFSAVREYVERMESRPSFRKTDSTDNMIIEGWQKKFQLPDRIAKQPQHA